jgi:CheY-like chemotaxis protein
MPDVRERYIAAAMPATAGFIEENPDRRIADVMGTKRQAPKMLIADDDPSIVRLLAEQCGKMGFDVSTASNGIVLLIKARRNHFDILIVDVNMPELDGLTVCSSLLASGDQSIEVIVVTGYSDHETIERCESLGLFYGRKGPDFWKSVVAALSSIFPDMAERITEVGSPLTVTKVADRPRVLVIDDDADVIRFFSTQLGKYGVDALSAPDARQGFKIACKEQPTAIISDYFMPDGDAHYLLSRLRSAPVTEHTPVFVISGRSLDETAEKAIKRDIFGRPGAAQVFKKSFDTKDLFGALQKYCGFKKSQSF